MYQLKIIGLGPGHEDYILPLAKREIADAEIILCGLRHAESFDTAGKKMLFIGQERPLSDLMTEVKGLYRHHQTALVVSGDTGFYSLLSYAKKIIPQEDIIAIPGISSLQYFFAKLNLTWEDARLASLHGRKLDLAAELQANDKLGLLTDKNQNTAYIARKLQEFGMNQRIIYVGQELSYATEKISRLTVAQALDYKEEGLAVVVVLNE